LEEVNVDILSWLAQLPDLSLIEYTGVPELADQT
jgi:hypothetical protein